MFTPEVIFLTILVFFLLVGIHEWGHFYFAKRAGILVREFAIGFGPKLFSYKKTETRWTIRMLPLGGFVRMAGEDPEIVQVANGQTIAVQVNHQQVTHLYLDRLDQRSDVIIGTVESIDLERKLKLDLEIDGDIESFQVHPEALMVTRGKETQIAPWNRQFGSKTVGQRAMAIFAGPMMNFVLAIILFLAFVIIQGVPTNIKMGEISANSAAEAAGLEQGDVILQVNNEHIGTDSNKLVNLIQQSPEQEMVWLIERNNEHLRKVVIPQNIEGVGVVGFQLDSDRRNATFTETISTTSTMIVNITKDIYVNLGKLVTLQLKLDDLGGPVRVVEFTGQAASLGYDKLVLWAAILSLYLGIFNLLPIPALDGSRLIFIGFEAIRGKPVDPNRESLIHFIGFAMLMLLMIAVTYNDILRLFKG